MQGTLLEEHQSRRLLSDYDGLDCQLLVDVCHFTETAMFDCFHHNNYLTWRAVAERSSTRRRDVTLTASSTVDLHNVMTTSGL